MQLCEGSVTFAEVFDLVLLVNRVELDVELTALVIVSRAHHRVHRWLLVFARVRVVRVVRWYDEIVHFFA
jgi:hypothetical protein